MRPQAQFMPRKGQFIAAFGGYGDTAPILYLFRDYTI